MEQKNEDINYQLLANPYHMKSNVSKNTIDDDIFTLLNKKFPGSLINKIDQGEILQKIEIMFSKLTIANIVEDIILKIENE